MSDLQENPFNGREGRRPGSGSAYPAGTPLSMGNRNRTSEPEAPPAAAEALPEQPLNTLVRAWSVLRSAVPFVQRLLPLLDGQHQPAVAPAPPLTHVRPESAPVPAPMQQAAPQVDLAPIQDGIRRLQADHRELRTQISEQTSSLKRVEDHLELVREATDRNTLEQQELMEDLKHVGTKVNLVTLTVIAMLLASLLLNLILYLHLQRILP